MGANANETVNVTTSYGGDTSLVVTFGQPGSAAIAWFKSKGYKVEDGTRYYLVREAVRATEIDYDIKQTDLVKLGGEATLKAISGQFNIVDHSSNGSYVLQAKFAEPLNVCIKPEELVAIGRAATGDQTLAFQPVASPLLTPTH